MDENMSKAEAAKKIDELQHKTGRGLKEKSFGSTCGPLMAREK